MKIKKYTMFAFLAVGFLLGATGAKAQNGIPPGSYQKSCKDIKVIKNELNANCNPKKSGFLGVEEFRAVYPLLDFFDCVGDISNNDGQLVCQKAKYPQKSPLMQAAEKALAGAYPTYFGEPYPAGDTRSWVIKMIEGGMIDQFYKGLKVIDAAAFLESYIKKSANANVRLGLINKAFRDVYGVNNDASPKDVAFWNAQASKTGNFYQDVVNGETQKLNSPDNKVTRRAMILFAYKKMMGKVPTKDEIAYWEPKTEIYKQILAAGRDFLYSSNGAKDLAATVERALTEKTGDKPSVGQINDAILQYTKTKAIFAEM